MCGVRAGCAGSCALEVDFADGYRFVFPADLLRVESLRAEVQGHVGNYAIRLVFDDLHDAGIYCWEYRHCLGREQPQRRQPAWVRWRPRASAAIRRKERPRAKGDAKCG
jgi:DUF971 family protein